MFNIEIKTIENSAHENDGTFLQTPFWCEFKSRHGWIYSRFNVKWSLADNSKGCNDCTSFELAVLNRNFAKNKFSIAYIPLMPGLPLAKMTAQDQTIEFEHFLCELAESLKSVLPKNTIAIRFDPAVIFDTIEERDEFNLGMINVAYIDKLRLEKSKVDIQPPDSTLVDLTSSEDEILGRMHSKWRYNIKLAAKKGVVIKRYTGDDEKINEKLDKFYVLTKETNARDGNSSHAKSYYLDLITSSAQERAKGKDVPVISLYIAEHEGDEIASIMTLFSKTESIYLYGASSNHKRNLMPNHLLQWTAMQDAKAYGSSYYDMYGMPPEGKDENHPMHGLYMFKNNFGGKNIHRTGSWDYPVKPALFSLYKTAEKARAFYHKKVVKKLKGR